MNDPDDVQRRLEQWGNDEQPSVDGAFANRLDAQLRVQHRDASDARRPIWQPAILALAALLVVVGGVFAFTRSDTDDLVVMAAATQTEVELPGGEIVAGAAGLELPDGTIISVGADGSAVIAGVVLEADTRAVIVDGQLEIQTRSDAIDAGGTQPSSTVAPTSTRPADGASTTAPPSTRPTTSSTGATTTTTSRRSTTTAVTAPQTATTQTSAPRTTETRTTDGPPPTTAPDPVVTLDWVERDGRIRLTWTYVGPDTLAGWHITVSAGDRVRTLAVLRDPAARAITVERLDGAATYRVAARDGDGQVIAESNAVVVPA